ncbi:MAG TPA: DsbA family protein, partial [Polyangiaceae bacterium]|nr:DsbA family protein [Polyangiaceae bacterium]
DVLLTSGLAPELLDAIGTAAIKEQLRAHTERAIALGVFGVPSFVVGTELFWGHDRVPHVEAHLLGALTLDEGLHAEVLARPRGADRAAMKR